MYEMIATGELPTTHIGRAVRVSSSALGKWVEELKQQEEDPPEKGMRKTRTNAKNVATHVATRRYLAENDDRKRTK